MKNPFDAIVTDAIYSWAGFIIMRKQLVSVIFVNSTCAESPAGDSAGTVVIYRTYELLIQTVKPIVAVTPYRVSNRFRLLLRFGSE